ATPGTAFCAHCGASLHPGATPTSASLPVQQAKAKNRGGCLVAGLIIAAAIIGLGALLGTPRSDETSSGGGGGGSAQLALLSFHCSTQYGYDTCTGEVKNIS